MQSYSKFRCSIMEIEEKETSGIWNYRIQLFRPKYVMYTVVFNSWNTLNFHLFYLFSGNFVNSINLFKVIHQVVKDGPVFNNNNNFPCENSIVTIKMNTFHVDIKVV